MPTTQIKPRILGTTRLIAVAAAGMLLAAGAAASPRSACMQAGAPTVAPAPLGQLTHQAELGLLAAARLASPSAAWPAASAKEPLTQPTQAALIDPTLDPGLHERIARYQITPSGGPHHGWASSWSGAHSLDAGDRQVAFEAQCGWGD